MVVLWGRQAYAAVMHELGASCHQLALLLWHALESAAWEDGAGTELDSVLQTGLRAGEHMLEVARSDAERRAASDQCASFHTLLGRFAALRLAHANNRPQARTVRGKQARIKGGARIKGRARFKGRLGVGVEVAQ